MVMFIRKTDKPEETILVVTNFDNVAHPKFRVGVPFMCNAKALISTDDEKYGGFGMVKHTQIKAKRILWDDRDFAIDIDIPSMSTTIYQLTPCAEAAEKAPAKKAAAKKSTSKKSSKKEDTEEKLAAKKTAAADVEVVNLTDAKKPAAKRTTAGKSKSTTKTTAGKAKTDSKLTAKKPEASKASKQASGAARRRKG